MIRFMQTILISGILALGSIATAQTSFNFNNTSSTFTYEFAKPSLDFGGDITGNGFLGTHYLSFTARLKPNIIVVGEMPLAHFSISSPTIGDISRTEQGNPYIGIQFSKPASNFILESGIHFPLVDMQEQSHLVGYSTDITERFESFAPNTLPIKIIGNVFANRDDGRFIHLRFGPSVMFNLADNNEVNNGDGTQLHILAALQGGIENKKVRVNAGLSSRILLSDNIRFGSDRSYHVAGFRLGLKFDLIEPLIIFKKTLNSNYTDLTETVISLGLRITKSDKSLNW